VIFKEALQTFLSGDIELAQLKTVLGNELRQEPAIGDTYLEVIQDTHFKGLLPDDTFSELRTVIARTGTGTVLFAPPVSAANETPQTGDVQTGDAPVGIGSKIGDQYVLMQELGRGGMGVVYKALDIKAKAANDRNPYVAIKLLSEEFKNHPDSLIALQREAKKSQMLAHPNIVNVFVFSFDAQVAWIVMEFLDGKPLTDLGDEPLSQEDALSYIKQMCSALQHAHNIKPQPVVHYDLKPANAFLTRNGVVKLLDFGIARVAPTGKEDDESDKTLFNPASLGALTPSYASYEMIRGVDPDPRDDIYSLACVAYELLTGQHPFERTSAVNAQAKRLKVKPVKGLTRGQNKALRDALAFEREDRTASVEDFVRELLPEAAQGSRKTLWGGLVASLLLIAASSVIWLPAALDDWRVYNFGQNLSSMSDPELTVALQDIQSLSSADAAEILQGEANVARVIEFYEAQTAELFNPQRGTYDYSAAEMKLRELQELLPGSAAAEQAAVTLERSKADELARLYGVHDIAIEQQQLISEDGAENLESVLDAIRQLDSRDLKLGDSNIAEQFKSGIEAAIRRQDYDRAERVAGVGTGFVEGVRARSELESAASLIARARLGEIVTLQGDYESLDTFNAAISAGDLDSAGQIFGEFESSGVPGQVQSEAADRLASEYHAEAQRQIAGNPNRAEALVALGLALNPTEDVAAQLVEMSALIRGGQAEQDEAEIARLRRVLGNRLSVSVLTLDDVGWSADTLMRLARLRVDTSTDRQQVINRVVLAGNQLIAAGSKAEAYNLASKASASFGDAMEIRDLFDRVNKMGGGQATPQLDVRGPAPVISAQVDELGKLLSADDLTDPRIKGFIGPRLRMIRREGGNVETALVRVIDAAMGRAAIFEASGQSATAAAHRKLAETYRAQLAPSTDSPEVARQKFDSAIAAGDMDTARRHFMDLKGILPATDVFLMQDGSEILIARYIELAQARSLEDDFDAADELLIRALEIAPSDARIEARQLRILGLRQNAGQ